MRIVLGRGWTAMLAIAALATALGPADAHASEADPWFGRDKALHFGVTFGLAAGGYAACAFAGADRPGRLACGAGLAMGAGIVKEILDLAGLGDASWRDLAWDAIGTATGLLAATAVDRWLIGEPEAESARPPAGEGIAMSADDAIELMRALEGRGVPRFAQFVQP